MFLRRLQSEKTEEEKSLNVSFIRFGSWFYMLLCTILCSSQLVAKGDPFFVCGVYF